ncbi:MAG: isoprenylcysteine carboxylmethyltransferase family protein [Herpetosiphonaceae bacterium]|nr:isoprenylcysteine carboxylmethyltransferase family protein [Herpetosiphonaceae bacterium]
MSTPTIQFSPLQTWHHSPAWLWLASFLVCIGGDALVGKWVLLPIYVAGFYGGMIVIDLCAYPLLGHWRVWLRQRGPWAWYLVEVGVLWLGTTLLLAILAPAWLVWSWEGLRWLQGAGAILLAFSVGIGVWAVGQMGWARVLFAAALFPPGQGAEEHAIPQRLVVAGPYRYVRNPLYDTDMLLILGAALLTRKWALIVLLGLYVAQLIMQLRLEERELCVRFGDAYTRYLALVPRFIPRLTPVDPAAIHCDT